MDIKTCHKLECPAEDLLLLIQQDDIEQLRKTLLDIISKFQGEGEIYLYEQSYDGFNSTKKAFSPKLIDYRGNKSADEISTSITEKFTDFNFLPTNDYVQVFIVSGERLTNGLLITVNTNFINDYYVNTLLSGYNHQAFLLKNKETDSLTGLLNRQSLDAKLSKLYKNLKFQNRMRDKTTQYSFAMLDIDFFKSVNDKFGHIYGDEVLLLFSKIMKETFRDNDLLFRYGGEEYAVLLNDANSEQAELALNRFRTNIEKFNFPMGNELTISIGHCEFNNDIPLSSIIERADKALYYSKENGRNQVNEFKNLLKQNKIKDINIIDDGDIEIF